MLRRLLSTDLALGSRVTPATREVRALQQQHRLSESDIARLTAEYQAGASVTALVAQFRVHRTTVLAHLERAGVQRRPHLRKLSETEVTQAARLYEAGTSLTAAAEQFGVHQRTMRAELARAGVVIRPRWPSSEGRH
jgi:hypothetical protein